MRAIAILIVLVGCNAPLVPPPGYGNNPNPPPPPATLMVEEPAVENIDEITAAIHEWATLKMKPDGSGYEKQKPGLLIVRKNPDTGKFVVEERPEEKPFEPTYDVTHYVPHETRHKYHNVQPIPYGREMHAEADGVLEFVTEDGKFTAISGTWMYQRREVAE